jgi:hypothetical protein
MEHLLFLYAIFLLVGWLLCEFSKALPAGCSVVAGPTSPSFFEAGLPPAAGPPSPPPPPRRIRRALARARPSSPPPPPPIFLSSSASPFASHYPVVTDRKPLFLDEEKEVYYRRMYRVDDPVLGWRWRAYPKGAHEARMQQLRENRDGKTPFMVEPETQSPAALHPPPRPSSPIVFTTSRPPLPPLPRPAGPVLPGIPTLTPLPTGVQLMATAAPRTAPNFMAQFAERCAAVRFAPLPWPSISFTEQFALSCRASLSLPLPWPVALSVALPPSAPLLAPPAPPAPVAPVASLPAATLPPLVLSAPFVPPATFHFVATAARHDRRPRLNPRRRATSCPQPPRHRLSLLRSLRRFLLLPPLLLSPLLLCQ